MQNSYAHNVYLDISVNASIYVNRWPIFELKLYENQISFEKLPLFWTFALISVNYSALLELEKNRNEMSSRKFYLVKLC